MTTPHQLTRRELLGSAAAAGLALTTSTLIAASVAAAPAQPAPAPAQPGPPPAQPTPKRIGFVDDYLDHSHSTTYLNLTRRQLKDRGFTVVGVTARQAEKGREWAAKHEVPYVDSVEKLGPQCDFFAVLAPNTPETHLELCQQVLPFGKPTFVDKMLAQDAATGEKILELADKHKAAIQASSALRYTAAQTYARTVGADKLRHVVAWSPGGSYASYAVHAVELTVSLLGPEVVSLLRRGSDQFSQLLINFSRDRTAVVNVYVKTATPYAAMVTTEKETKYFPVDTGKLFLDAATGLFDFFDAGKPNIDRAETRAILKIIEASRSSDALEKFVTL